MKLLKLPLLVLTVLLLSTCSKRPFVHVWVKGRVLSARTGQPLTAAINLWIKSSSSSNGTLNLASSRTGTDGTFSIKSHAQYNGNVYYLDITPDSILTYSAKEISYPISKGHTANAGDIKL